MVDPAMEAPMEHVTQEGTPRIRSLQATPMPDGRRVVVELELEFAPSPHRPDLELILYNARGEEVHSMAVMEVMELRPAYVLHLRQPDPGAPYRVEARLLAGDRVLDRQETTVRIPEPITVQDDETLRRILREARVIAVVGLSADPERPSHQVASYLQRQGYRIIPVNPTIPGGPGGALLPGSPLRPRTGGRGGRFSGRLVTSRRSWSRPSPKGRR
jgi:hypothetical protein